MNNTEQIAANKARMADILARLRNAKTTPAIHPQVSTSAPSPENDLLSEIKTAIQAYDRFGNPITYNTKQQQFIDLVASGKSCVLIGAAGTGKTTCMRGAMLAAIHSGFAGVLNAEDHKHLSSGTPGIVITAYTRRAVANISRNVSDDMKPNCLTNHKLLEYSPVYYDVIDSKSGDLISKMSFEATRSAENPNPASISIIAFEESSMLGIDLFRETMSSLPHNPQLIFLGDIQQLPPVFGPAILGFKLLSLPVIELTEVYRQALDSPIIRLAHRILSGISIRAEEFHEWNVPGKLRIHPWNKKISAEAALSTIELFFCGNSLDLVPAPGVPLKKKIKGAIETGAYDPAEDIILMPFNEKFGTVELNKSIANFLARSRSAITFEIIAGFNAIYLSAGDKILYEKEDATILKIESNPAYAGKEPILPSSTLDYWGYDPVRHARTEVEHTQKQIDMMLSAAASTEDRVRQCSHILTIMMHDSGREIRISRASDVNSILLGYALTVHKAQGSEWRRVFVVLHQSHNTMISRELLYTAVTRAREELFIICEPDHFIKGIASQRVRGDTLAEKAEFFKGKLEEGGKYDDL